MKCLIFFSIFSLLFTSCAKFSKQESVDYKLLSNQKKYKYDVIQFVTQTLVGCEVQDCNDLFVQDDRNLSHTTLEKIKNGIKVELNKGVKKPKVLNVFVDLEFIGKAENNFFAFLSGLTLMILPFKYEESYQIRAVVLKEGKVFKHYVHKTEIDVWVQLLLVFALPFQSGKEDEVVNKLYDKVLEGLVKDNII